MNFEDTVKTILAVVLGVVIPVIGLVAGIKITGVNPFTRLGGG